MKYENRFNMEQSHLTTSRKGKPNLRRPPRKQRMFAHTVRAPVWLQLIISFWFSVWCWKLPHAVVHWTLSCGKCRDSCGHDCADWKSRQLWGARCYSFSAGWWDLRLPWRRRKLSRKLFYCTTMHVRILPGRHKPCCISNSIGTSSNIFCTVRTWHFRTFSCFQNEGASCW